MPGRAAMLNCFCGAAKLVAAKLARTAARSHLAMRHVAFIDIPRFSGTGMDAGAMLFWARITGPRPKVRAHMLVFDLDQVKWNLPQREVPSPRGMRLSWPVVHAVVMIGYLYRIPKIQLLAHRAPR